MREIETDITRDLSVYIVNAENIADKRINIQQQNETDGRHRNITKIVALAIKFLGIIMNGLFLICS